MPRQLSSPVDLTAFPDQVCADEHGESSKYINLNGTKPKALSSTTPVTFHMCESRLWLGCHFGVEDIGAESCGW